MNKPWVIWSLSALCAILVFGAMALITQHTLGLEKDRAEAEARAELEERIRLSLWRMDTAAAGILAEENSRPAWHFRDVNFQSGRYLTPLNVDIPEKVKLHFEVNGDMLTSPQVNGWGESVGNWRVAPSELIRGSQLSKKKEPLWSYFQDLLLNDGTYKGWQSLRNVQSDRADNNLGLLREIVHRDRDELILPRVDEELSEKNVIQAVEQRTRNSKAKVRSLETYQNDYNVAEKTKRKQIVKESVDKNIPNQTWSSPKKSVQEAVRRDSKKPERLDLGGLVAEGSAAVGYDFSDLKAFPDDGHLSPLRPIWLAADLILVRDVQDLSGDRVQGVWLDTEAIKSLLLKNIVDLLPNAKLEPARQSLKVMLGEAADPNADDPMVLAALPWRLIPGEVATVMPVGWTPMRKTLGVAWVGALLAALAAVALLRGVVKLSERRASFVSSVTHELRTPLTTFGLYSDMLAEGMIKDEKKQSEYLHTLRKESSRLTHLVENVLAYSRIERGSARARVERIKVGTLIDRVCERLRSRAEEADMELHCSVLPELADRDIQVDTTAVEQILFNLVDNASKYASGEGDGNVIELSVVELARGMAFRVCDQGPGIPKSERRKLFKAFHKSAQEAAHTKPGVGLGLALCRRLARALRGDLRILDRDKGSCFEFSLRC